MANGHFVLCVTIYSFVSHLLFKLRLRNLYMGSSVSLLWMQCFIPWRISCGCLKLLPNSPLVCLPCLVEGQLLKRFYWEHKRVCPFESLAVLAFDRVYSRRSFMAVFKNISLRFFCSMQPRKRKMNIPQKWLNMGQKSIGYDSKLMKNTVKVIWIKIPNWMLAPRVWDVS